MHCIHRRIYSKNLIVGEGILPLSYINSFLSSAWVDIEKYGHGCVAFVLQQLGACFRHALACERKVDALLELDDNLAYRLGLYTCHSRSGPNTRSANACLRREAISMAALSTSCSLRWRR